MIATAIGVLAVQRYTPSFKSATTTTKNKCNFKCILTMWRFSYDSTFYVGSDRSQSLSFIWVFFRMRFNVFWMCVLAKRTLFVFLFLTFYNITSVQKSFESFKVNMTSYFDQIAYMSSIVLHCVAVYTAFTTTKNKSQTVQTVSFLVVVVFRCCCFVCVFEQKDGQQNEWLGTETPFSRSFCGIYVTVPVNNK